MKTSRKLARFVGRLGKRLVANRRVLVGALVVLAPLCLLNLAVAFFGRCVVFPLSPFHLGAKVRALAFYAAHRPQCLLRGHPDLEADIRRAEQAHKLPRGLLAALVEVESSGRVHRISPAGAMGPGQLVPSTAAELGVTDPFDPADALDGSARYLAAQLRRFRDVRLALAAYNAGPGAVAGHVPHNGETEHYVERVVRIYRQSRQRHRSQRGPAVAVSDGRRRT